jgi:hypothetical protein
MDLGARIEAMLLELDQARDRLAKVERLLADGRASITARDARLGGAHQLAQAQHAVDEARRLVTEASDALQVEMAALPPRPAH